VVQPAAATLDLNYESPLVFERQHAATATVGQNDAHA
jgi:hypothetical protein